MAKNTVEVRFAGEASGFNRVVKQVAENSEESAGRMKRSFDKAGEAADSSESKFMGMADVLDGLGGAFGIPTEGATNMMRSFGDLSGGFAILQPAIGGVTSSMKAMGLSMLTNPIFLVVAVVAALAAAFYFAYTRSETFREIVDNALRVVSAGFQWLWGVAQGAFGWIADNWKTLAFVIAAPIAVAVSVISAHWDKIVTGVRWVGDVIGAVFYGAWGTVKTIFNAIAWAWNNTLGRLSIAVPDVPGLPFRGQRFNVPNIPMLAKGGIVTGPTLAMIGEAGPEAVVPLSRGGGFGGININFNGVTTRETADQVVRILNDHFGRGGGLTDGRGGSIRPA